MAKKKITYSSIVPLIGGENFGIHESLGGQLPEYVLSYTPFKDNDKHYISYLRNQKKWKGDYVFLDENPDYHAKHVNAVNAVCPCAGLSSLSHQSSSDSAINKWMYESAEYVLKNIKPDVFWGENAPRLSTEKGRPVADKLYQIGRENGYSMTLYYTESRLHGLSQKRPRTFYFLMKGDQAPILNRFFREPEPIESILEQPAIPNDPMDVLINDDDPMNCGFLQYCMAKEGAKTLKQFYKKIDSSTVVVRSAIDDYSKRDAEDVIAWMIENKVDDKYIRRAQGIKKKLAQGLGYWAHGNTVLKGVIPAFVSMIPYCSINAQKGRFLTVREALRIMKMPDDFVLANENPLADVNHICQNVPVTTAKDMADEVTRMIRGEIELAGSTYIRQSNKNGEIRYLEEAPKATIESFL
jgi:site-specific DNA-cytosine methylase